MKNKLLKYCSFVLILLAVGGGFTACDDDDDTNGTVQLHAFGPSPALRGGELKFIGRNLGKVTAIVLPDNVIVKEITAVSDLEIKIIVPEETVDGYVTLKTPDGDIVTKTKLTISEPISITKFYKTGSEGTMPVMPGDEITIEGDYLNLVREVMFASNATVSLNRQDEAEYPRNVIKVTVPLDAQTGPITLSNGAEIPILVESEKALVVAEAKVTSLSPHKADPGKELTITGSNLHLVKSVKFDPGINVEIPANNNPFTPISNIKVIVPDGTQTGNVTLILYSGIEVLAGKIEVSAPVFSEYPEKANIGEKITFAGANLDNVKSLTFGNVEVTAFSTQTPTTLSLIVPAGAKLGLYNLKAVDKDNESYLIPNQIEIMNIDPVLSSDLMLMDFEKHDEHEPITWDPSWGSVSEILAAEDGNYYARITKAFGAEQWVVNCNHQAQGAFAPVIDDVTKYVMKIDVKVEKDFRVGSENEFTMVFGGKWTAKTATFFPLANDGVTCTTGGGWITVTIDLASFGLTSGQLDFSSGDYGLFVKTDGMDPTGLCLDNWRFSKK